MRKRDSVICLCALALAVVLLVSALRPNAVETGSWGLSFQTQGQAPVGSASQEALAQYDAAFLGDTQQPVLYLTFDAGYENGCTAQILDVLKAHQVPAAFFWWAATSSAIRSWSNAWPKKDILWATIPPTTTTCPKLGTNPPSPKSSKRWRTCTGTSPARKCPYYRPPQGIYSQENLSMAQELGYKTVFWSLAYVDWNNDSQPTREEAFAKLIPRIHNGAVILLHSTSKTNAAILDELLTKWEDMGYRFDSLDALFA